MQWIWHPAAVTMLYRTAALACRKREDTQIFEGAQLQLRRCQPFSLSSRGGLQPNEGSVFPEFSASCFAA
jgi:hypothetical protein